MAEFDAFLLQQKIEDACLGLDAAVQAKPVLDQTFTSLYSGITEQEIVQAAIFAARAQVEMPLCEMAYRVLYEGLAAQEAVRALMNRPIRAEEG